jgi:4,5-DOPA dioxygenase extradiol
MSMPTLFVSHGSPMLFLEQGLPARAFLATLGKLVPRPEAIVAVSAHWNTEQPAVSLAARPETIHDFYGFPDALYRLHYDAPGAPGAS